MLESAAARAHHVHKRPGKAALDRTRHRDEGYGSEVRFSADDRLAQRATIASTCTASTLMLLYTCVNGAMMCLPLAMGPNSTDTADKPKVSANGATQRGERAGCSALLSSPKGDRAGRDASASGRPATPASDVAMVATVLRTPGPGDVIQLAPNILSIKHWDRLLGGLLYTVQPRLDWASLLRRSFSVDVLECPKCHGRLRVLALITEREPVQRILAHLGLPTEPPPLAQARDPTDDVEDEPAQLDLGLP